MKVGVFAAGATGGFFGGLLARAGHSVYWIARGSHLAAIQAQGLHIESRTAGNFTASGLATDQPAMVGQCDLVLFAIKSRDLEAGIPAIAPLVGEKTLIVPLLNGVDAPERLRGRYGGRVLGGSCSLEVTVTGPGHIAQPSDFATFTLGELDGGSSDRARALGETLRAANIDITVSEDMPRALWRKLMLIAPTSALTTLMAQPMGAVYNDPEALQALRGMVAEIAALGRAAGVALTDSDLQQALAAAEGLSPAMKTSMLRDREAGRPLETDLIQGALVRRAEAHGMAMPITRRLYDRLRTLPTAPA